MSINFETLNLEILDANLNATPDIYINAKGITFSKRAVEELGYPAHVQYSIDPKQKVFAVKAIRLDGAKATPFSKPRNEQKSAVSTGNRNIWEPVRKMMDGAWNPTSRYRVTGILVDDKKTLMFYLPDGVEEEFRIDKTMKRYNATE
ncbi:MAG: hypothetical protein BWY15_02203 [Firmicutes bacterium ADurb.Bin193]|nr:MAG: hypothetical protein BWY15_02203 [Firmicutes bacterium ADurb.Bin193]